MCFIRGDIPKVLIRLEKLGMEICPFTPFMVFKVRRAFPKFLSAACALAKFVYQLAWYSRPSLRARLIKACASAAFPCLEKRNKREGRKRRS